MTPVRTGVSDEAVIITSCHHYMTVTLCNGMPLVRKIIRGMSSLHAASMLYIQCCQARMLLCSRQLAAYIYVPCIACTKQETAVEECTGLR